MDDSKKLTPEELEAEQAELTQAEEVKEEDVREKVIEELGFDAEEDKDKIDLLVKKEMESSKKLSTAIKQKIKQRTAKEALMKSSKEDDDDDGEKGKEGKKDDKKEDVDVDAAVNKALEGRDLEDMDMPDEIKEEIKKLADLQGVSVKKAAKDPYIAHLVEKHEEKQEEDEAGIQRKNKTGGGGSYKFDANTPPDSDMSTEEGRKEYDAWKKKAKEAEGK